MLGRNSFSTLRSRMSPEAQERARAKSEVLESGMSSLGGNLIQAMREALAHAREEGPAVVHTTDDRARSKRKIKLDLSSGENGGKNL